jgi:hypothetical protein
LRTKFILRTNIYIYIYIDESTVAVDSEIGSDIVLLKVRETNWIFLRSWEGGVKPFWRDQNKDKNTSKPTTNTPTHLMRSINTRRREKVTLPLPKVVCSSCMSSCMLLFPSSFPTKT